MLAVLEPDDLSLSYDAAARTVHRHAGGRSEVVGDDIFEALSAALGPGEEWFGWFGYASRPDLPARTGGSVPDAVWMRPSHRIELPAPAVVDPASPPGPTQPMPEEYRDAFARVQAALRAGHSYEVNLTIRERSGSGSSPEQVYDRLRRGNPAPYSGIVAHDIAGHAGWLLSASPERYLRLTDRILNTRPIKGTAPRGATPAEDARWATELASSAKTRAENLMVTDLLRNDVAMVSEPGSVQVPELMVVESHPSVHQLVSTVTGRLRHEFSTLDAVRALFPAGSMTGAPKLRTMEIIEQVEATARGVYAGAFGMLSDSSADLAVVIRSLTSPGDGTWQWGSGGGITVDSDVEAEWAELCWKAERIRHALT